MLNSFLPQDLFARPFGAGIRLSLERIEPLNFP
jgi:hypothetical protein